MMLRPNTAAGWVLAGVLVLSAAPLLASWPCGIYAVIERVVLEPDAEEPQAIQIWGAFALSDQQFGGWYLPAQKGYLYYTCAKGLDATCFNEWRDLKSVAGTGQLVGFVSRYQPRTAPEGLSPTAFHLPRIRTAGEAPGSPDIYPIQMGVLKGGPTELLPDLRAALAKP